MVAAVIVMRRSAKSRKAYRTFGYPIVPLVYIVLTFLFVIDLGYPRREDAVLISDCAHRHSGLSDLEKTSRKRGVSVEPRAVATGSGRAAKFNSVRFVTFPRGFV
jgi:hypothetical protein